MYSEREIMMRDIPARNSASMQTTLRDAGLQGGEMAWLS